MGMQGIDMPMATFGNPVMEADVAGVALSLPSSRELGMTAFWARPFDRSYGAEDQIGGKNSLDDMDLFGIMFPIKSDAVRATSWGMFAFIGKDSDFYTNARNFNRGNRSIDTGAIDGATRAWWLGMALELPALDPFFVKLDAMAGALDTGVDDYNTLGWMISGDIGYDFSWGKLSALGWYSSGDDDTNDRGQIPIISDDGGFRPTRYGTGGTSARSFDRVLTSTGRGLWGLGLKLATVSFVDNLNHTFIAMYMGGTNKKDALTQNRSTGDSAYDARFARDQLATSDRAWEIDWLNTYKVRDNLTIQLDFACVWLDLGDTWANKNDTEGSFATMIGFTYSF
jgi:hypothetical protein